MANHLKPIYVPAYLKGIPFKRVLIDGRVAVNVLPYKKMKKICRSEEDLILTDLIISSFSRAITRTHGILPLEVDLEPDKPPLEVQDPLETIDLGTKEDPRPIQISGLLETKDRARIISILHEFNDCFAWHYNVFIPYLGPRI
ncbi:hypothetical protein ACFX14_034291 [Malus domestica]